MTEGGAFRPDEEFRRALLETFAGETRDELDAISSGLLELERDASSALAEGRVEEMMRAAHSLKGSARAVELEQVDRIAHALETMMSQVSERGHIESDTADLGYRALDAIEALVEAATGGTTAEVNVSEICDALTAEGDRGEGQLAQAQPIEELVVEEAQASPPSAADAPLSEPQRAVATDQTVRISVEKLDQLVASIRELESARVGIASATEALVEAAEREDIQTRQYEHRSAAVRSATQAPLARLEAASKELTENIAQARTVPISLALDPLRRAVRDLAKDLGRSVEVELEQVDIDVDRAIVEVLRPALLHVVRNAVDHGIEPPATRLAAGKSEAGVLRITARTAGPKVVVSIDDDGAGIDAEAVRRRAIEQGLASEGDLAGLDYEAIARLVLRPGFTTRDKVSKVSGRGVGLDAVAEAMASVQGSVTISSEMGAGTEISLIAPLAIAATECLVAEVSGKAIGIALTDAERVIELEDGKVPADGTGPVQVLDSESMKVLDSSGSSERRYGVVISSEGRRIALPVDAVRSVIRLGTMPIPRPINEASLVQGAAILPDGEAMRIADPRALIATLPPAPLVLVVDDSPTQRERAAAVFREAGFEVEAASSGREALGRVQSGTVEAVVADLEMPEMSGFELTRRIRTETDHSSIPVLIWTAAGAGDLERQAYESGADGFFSKGPEAEARLVEALLRRLEATKES